MDVIVAALAGVALGIVTGITPGIHVNLVASLLLAFFPFLPFAGVDAAVFIVSIAITHTFLDIIPSVFLGVPDSATALGVLPGHRYVLRGHGLMAVKLSTIGALGGLILGCVFFQLFAKLTTVFELVSKFYIGLVLLCIPVVMLLRDKKKLAAATIVVLSSAYGFVGFLYTDPLFPMLSGLFGASTLLYSINDRSVLPAQECFSFTQLRTRHAVQALIGGLVAGGLTAVLPGVGAAHAAVLGMLFALGTGDHGFLVLTGAIGTTNFFLSLAAYSAVEKARNGALLVATTIQPTLPVLVLVGAALFAGGVGALFTLLTGRQAAVLVTRLPYRQLTIGILVFVTALVIALSGWQGVVLYVVGAAIGLVAAATKAARAHAMSCILVPVAWRFLGF